MGLFCGFVPGYFILGGARSLPQGDCRGSMLALLTLFFLPRLGYDLPISPSRHYDPWRSIVSIFYDKVGHTRNTNTRRSAGSTVTRGAAFALGDFICLILISAVFPDICMLPLALIYIRFLLFGALCSRWQTACLGSRLDEV